jgi:hypothetical protein
VPWAMFGIAATQLYYLIIGIRNAWDLADYLSMLSG